MLIEMKVDSLAVDPVTNVPILILKNDAEKRSLARRPASIAV